jgi:hypothetical protein
VGQGKDGCPRRLALSPLQFDNSLGMKIGALSELGLGQPGILAQLP